MKNEPALEQLTKLVGKATAWGDGVTISFKVTDNGVSASADICGARTEVSAWGKDHRSALIDLLKKIEMHHHGVARWYVARLKGVRAILDELDIYYVKSPVEVP
jgi:hypothetical protein